MNGVVTGFLLTLAAAFVGLIAGVVLGASGILRLSNGVAGDVLTIMGPPVLVLALMFRMLRGDRDKMKGFYIAASLVLLLSAACVGGLFAVA